MNSILSKCVEETGRELSLNNQDIVKYLCSIEEERNTLEIIIQKQYQERKRIEAEIEKLTYKLCLINKSLSCRIKAKNNYDKTVEEIKRHYEQLVNNSTTLKNKVEKTQQDLDGIMNKRIGTGNSPSGEEIKMLYVKTGENRGDECPCDIPTKEIGQQATNSTTSKRPSNDSKDGDGGYQFPSDLPNNNQSQLVNDKQSDHDSGNQLLVEDRTISQLLSVQSSASEKQKSVQLSDDNTSQLINENQLTGTNQKPLKNAIRSADEIDEVEVASYAPDRPKPPRASDQSSAPMEPTTILFNTDDDLSQITVPSIEKPGGPLPDVKAIVETQTTNVLLARLKKNSTISKKSEYTGIKPKMHSKILRPTDKPPDDSAYSESIPSVYETTKNEK